MTSRCLYQEPVDRLALNNDKMAFLVGPRQVGKTTLARQVSDEYPVSPYYTWDDLDFRRAWTKNPKALVPERPGSCVVLDELHKAPRWKSTLKGLYDLYGKQTSFVVTGSARLDVFRKGGDSLLGRYFPFRIHPFSVGEIIGNTPSHPDDLARRLSEPLKDAKEWKDLTRFGGFPDPFLKGEEDYHNLWVLNRQDRLVREDLADLTRIRDVALMQSLMALVPARVGSPFSVQSLSEDLELNFPTTKRWLGWLEQLFYLFIVPPYSKKVASSLKKQPKIYLWDSSEIKDPGVRFENMVASHLLKACHYWTDTGKGRFELFYVRDKLKREVDFLIVRDRVPWMLAEAKTSDLNTDAHLLGYAKQLDCPLVLQVVETPGIQKKIPLPDKKSGWLISAPRLMSCLP